MSPRSIAAASRNRVLGVAFLVLVLLFVWLTYAIFTKKFVDYVPVTLKTSSIGLQLPALADVKIRGVIVGDVRKASSNGEGATLHLAIDPDKAQVIPENASARILPKTLFGEKFVALQVPAAPSPRSIQAGDVIRESHVGIEVEQVLSDIYPLLRTVQPAQLNVTLTAIADALEGRGEKIGENLVVLDDYLKRTNPQIPLLVKDLRQLSSVSDTYRQVVPELANLLRNSVTTGSTFVDEEQKIQALFDDVAGLSSTSRDFLQQNGDNIIRLGRLGQAQLPLFAKYSPEYPCLLKGLMGLIPREEQAFRGYTLHIDLETIPKQPRGYEPRDSPQYAEHNIHIPLDQCASVLSGYYDQHNLPPASLIPQLHDGVDYPLGKQRAATGFDLTSGYAGTSAERSVVDAVAAPAMGVPLDRVPDVASLLFGPLARGAEVSLR
jgi:phospholipid/cholesterol/gamma-HCH transport system substrate-binding protein